MAEESNEDRTDVNGNPIGDRDRGNQYVDKSKEIRLKDGTLKTISFDRLERIEHVGSRLARGETLRTITDELEEHGFDEVSYRQIQDDAEILREMESAEISNQILFTQVRDLIRQGNEAISEMWDVLEDEKKKPNRDPDGETKNSFARIKAVKQAFNIRENIVKRLQKLGMDMKRAQFMGEANDDSSDKDLGDIDDEIEKLIDDE